VWPWWTAGDTHLRLRCNTQLVWWRKAWLCCCMHARYRHTFTIAVVYQDYTRRHDRSPPSKAVRRCEGLPQRCNARTRSFCHQLQALVECRVPRMCHASTTDKKSECLLTPHSQVERTSAGAPRNARAEDAEPIRLDTVQPSLSVCSVYHWRGKWVE
jgi:hypothetical protein